MAIVKDNDTRLAPAIEIAERVPQFIRRLLVVGCEYADLGPLLRARGTPEIHGVAWDAAHAAASRTHFDSITEGALPGTLLPFPAEYFDGILFTSPTEYLDRLSAVAGSVAPLLKLNGFALLYVPNAQYWNARDRGSDPESLHRHMDGAGLMLYGAVRIMDAELHSTQPDEEGVLHLGGRSFAVASDQELTTLLVKAYFFAAVRPGYDPLVHEGEVFDAGHPDWAYEILTRIPLPYLEDHEVCANIHAEIMLCQLAMDRGSDDRLQSLNRFAIAQEAFYRVVARMPTLHMAYQCQAQFWRRIGNDGMAARLLRSVQHAAPDARTRAQLDTLHPENDTAFPGAPVIEWTPKERRPRVLFVTHLRPHYGLDILYDGICTVLGGDNVVEFPWKPSLHGRPPREMANYPCMFDLPGQPLAFEDLLAQLEGSRFDAVLFGDLEQSMGDTMVRRIMRAASSLPIFLVDAQDDARDARPRMMAYLGVSAFAGYFKREMLACVDYGPNVFPLPFAYPDARVPTDVNGERPSDLFWAGHREFGLRRLYLERLEAMLNRRLDEAYSPEAYARALLESRIGLNIFGCGFDTVRYWEVPAHGCMLLSERLPIRIPHDFDDGVSAIFFDDLPGLEAKLAQCMLHPEESAAIAQRGHAHFLRYHTGSARACQALGWMQAALP